MAAASALDGSDDFRRGHSVLLASPVSSLIQALRVYLSLSLLRLSLKKPSRDRLVGLGELLPHPTDVVTRDDSRIFALGSVSVVLQVGQTFGFPGVRGDHILPHRSHLCSVITSMYSTLRTRKRKVVAQAQAGSCSRASWES